MNVNHFLYLFFKMTKKSLLSTNLRELMTAHGNLSEAELAHITGLPQPTLNHILQDKTKRPRRDCLSKLAEFFNISTQQLLGELPIASAQLPKGAHAIPLIRWTDITNFFEKPLSTTAISTTLCDTHLSQNAFALKMNDCSMSPLFPEKTILIFDPTKAPYDRGYGLFELQNNTLVFRQIILDGTDMLIKALNPDLGNFIKRVDTHERLIAPLVQAKMEFF